MKIHDCKDDDKVGAGADETQQTHAAGVGEIHWHGDVDPLESRPQLINKVLPGVGCGLISGQWGTYKTFVAIDIATSAMSGVNFIDFAVIRKGGVLFIAAEGASEVPARIEAAIKAKCPDLHPAPFAWIEACPALIDPHTSANLAAKAKVVADRMKAEWKLPLALIVITQSSSAPATPRKAKTTTPRSVSASCRRWPSYPRPPAHSCSG